MRHIFVRNRNEVSIGLWKPETRELHATKLLRIGTNHAAGEIGSDVLGFEEVHFEYFRHLDANTYVAFRLENEKTVTQGYLVHFD